MAIESLHISFDTSDILLYILSFFLPPLAVLIRKGFWTSQFFLNLLLTLFFGLPGLIHALYIVYTTSHLTGNQSRRVGDYESLSTDDINGNNSNSFTPNQSNNTSQPNDPSSFNQSPPAYNDDHYSPNTTDNKVQAKK